MNRVVIGVGSNIDPDENIARARDKIAAEFCLLGESRWVKTKPVGFSEQANFINGALLIETRLRRDELKARLRKLETQLGRVRAANRDEPRPIDLDIVVWNGEVVDPDVHERAFLRAAVLDVLPDLPLHHPPEP